jgi:hypothetical protein
MLGVGPALGLALRGAPQAQEDRDCGVEQAGQCEREAARTGLADLRTPVPVGISG